MPGSPTVTESAVVECVRERGEATLRELCRAVDDDTGAVFLCCRRLDDEGVLRAVRPLVYELADPEEDGTDDFGPGTPADAATGRPDDGDVREALDRLEARADGASDDADDRSPADAADDAADGETPDDDFDWVSFDEDGRTPGR